MQDNQTLPRWRRMVSWLAIGLALSLVLFPPQARAAFLSSKALFSEQGVSLQRGEDLSRIERLLESKIIHQRLFDLGLDESEIMSRMGQLTDEQIHQAATQLDALIPGGDGGLGVVIALLVIAILVVVLIQLTDHKVIITK